MKDIDEDILKELEEQEAKKPPHKPNIPIVCIFLILASAVLPLLILYSNNAGIRPLEFLLPTAVVLVAAVVVFGILWLILRKPVFAALCASVTVLMAMNFHLFRSGAKLLFEGKVAAGVAFIAWLLVLGALIFVLIRIRKMVILPQIAEIVCIAMAVLIVFNTVRVVPRIVKQAELDRYPSQSPESAPAMISENEMKMHTVEQNGRNFYWIILDEYADAYTMETYFHQDSNSFLSYLKEKGFSVSENSYSNSNNSTLCAIDVATLSYYSSEAAIRRENGEKDPTKDGSSLRRTGELYTALHNLGYQVYQVSSHPDHYPVVQSLLPQSFMERLMVSTTVDGLSVLDLAKRMSVFSVFPELFSDEDGDEDTVSAQLFNASFRTRILSVFEYYDDSSNLCFKEKTALFTYILCPHTPFVFDADGNNVSSKYRRDWTDPSHYAAQHHYMTVRTQQMVESILKVDPDAVILIQSDHGVRGGYFINDGLEVALSDQCRIFNALYFGGEAVDIEGLSAVNTMRTVLTRLGLSYPVLDDADIHPYYYEKQLELESESE